MAKLFQQQQHEIQFPWFSTFEGKKSLLQQNGWWMKTENQGSKILVAKQRFGGLLRKLKIDQER